MATYGPDDVDLILLGGYSVSGYLTEFSDEKEALTEETTTFGDEWVENSYVGLSRGSISFSGYFDDDTGASDAALVGGQSASRVIGYGVEGNALGKRLTCLQGSCETKYGRAASRGELHKVNAEITVSGSIDEAQIVAPLAARTTAGNTDSTSLAAAAATTAGGQAYLFVTALALGGYTNVVFTLRDSADNITFGDVVGGGFTAVTAIGSQRIATAADLTIKKYTSVSWAWTGSGSDQSVTACVALKRN